MFSRKTEVVALAVLALPLALASCSLDVLPVHPYRVKAAQRARAPHESSPSAEQLAAAAFVKSWTFKSAAGFRFDPSRIEISEGAARPVSRGLASDRLGGDRLVIETSSGRPFAALESFSENVGPAHRAAVRYQLSNDGTNWFHHDGARWTKASARPASANTASEVSRAIASFPVEAGLGNLYVKAFLGSSEQRGAVELLGFEVRGYAPERDSAD